MSRCIFADRHRRPIRGFLANYIVRLTSATGSVLPGGWIAALNFSGLPPGTASGRLIAMNGQQAALYVFTAMALLTGCDRARGRFNLSCRAHTNDPPVVLRVDLVSKQWCTDACIPERIAKITANRITFEDDDGMTIYVDRMNGRLISSMHAPGMKRLDVAASCVTQPFTGFPSRQPYPFVVPRPNEPAPQTVTR
jgi:hypothetical protein